MVRMMGYYRVHRSPTIISRVGDAERHHACVCDGVEERLCGQITRAFRLHATKISCRCEKSEAGGGLCCGRVLAMAGESRRSTIGGGIIPKGRPPGRD